MIAFAVWEPPSLSEGADVEDDVSSALRTEGEEGGICLSFPAFFMLFLYCLAASVRAFSLFSFSLAMIFIRCSSVNLGKERSSSCTRLMVKKTVVYELQF